MVSIIIPVYNVAPYLQKCLQSCSSQIYQDLEIIAVDDGSTDASGRILDEYAQTEKRLKVIHQKNAGLQAARRKGMEHATGDYVYFLDSDDTLPDIHTLQCMVDLFTDAGVQIVVGRVNMEKEGKVCLFPSDVFDRVDASVYLTRYLLCGRTGWNVCGKLYRISTLKRISNNPIHVTSGEDALYLIMLVAGLNGSICMTDRPVYNYFIRPGSISQSKSVRYIEDNFSVADYVAEALKDSVSDSYLTAFRLLCFSGSFRYGWLGKNHPLYQKVLTQYQRTPGVLRLFKRNKALRIWLLIHFGDFLSKHIYHNMIPNEGQNN